MRNILDIILTASGENSHDFGDKVYDDYNNISTNHAAASDINDLTNSLQNLHLDWNATDSI